MAIRIRAADLSRDRDEFIRFSYENLTKQSGGPRFDWLYEQNPAGQARAWMAIDEVSGRTEGVAAAFPRSIWLDGESRRAWVLGDFCIATHNRSLGPALVLQRACLTSLASTEDPIYYDFPSRGMMAIYGRLGIPTVANLVRYVKLIRIDNKVRSYISLGPLASGISTVGNLVLRFPSVWPSVLRDVEVSLHEGPFGEEFTDLDSRTARAYPIRGLRTAEYLNWRYLQNPLRKYRVVVARRQSEFLGYAVLEVDGSKWILADLHAIEEVKTVPAILAYLDNFLLASDVEQVTASIMAGSSLASYLRRSGFYPREGHPVVARIGGAQSLPLSQTTNWFLMHGDRES